MTDEKKLAIQHALVHYDGNGSMPYCDLVYEGLKAINKLEQAQAENKELKKELRRWENMSAEDFGEMLAGM